MQPVSHGNDSFIVKMNPAGTALTYSTPFGGGNGGATGTAIAIDGSGSAYVTGYTTASDFPITSGAPQAIKPGGQSNTAFVAKIGIQTHDCAAITIDPQPLATAIFRQSYNQQLTASGGTAPYTFSLSPNFGNNVLPLGLTLTPDGVISGVPTTTNFGTSFVTVQAVAANGCIGIRTLQLVLVERQPQLQVSVIGRTAILRGRENRYTFAYSNNGDADVIMVPLYIRFPNYFTWRRDFRLLDTIQPLAGPAIDYSQVPLDYQSGDQTIVPLLLPRIKARSSGSISIIISVPDQPEFANINYQIEAQLGSPLLNSVSTSPGATNLLNPRVQYFCTNGAKGQIHSVSTTAASGGLDPCGQAVLQLGFDSLGFIPGVNCATQTGFFLGGVAASYIASGGDGAGTFTGALAGAYSTAVGCVLGSTPFGTIVAAAQFGVDAAAALIDCNDPSAGGSLMGRTVSSIDPNDKTGSSGFGPSHYVSVDTPLPYLIQFENKATATAPAQTVVITDQLDVSKFDLSTFSFGEVAVGGQSLSPLPNTKTFFKDFDLRPTNNIIARINANLDSTTGLITWNFQSIDPATGQPTDDPLAGILPPNTNPPNGEGSVMFTVKLRSGQTTGTEVRNHARIVFDTNAPIDTPEWLNTIDSAKPVSSVQSLPATVPSSFTLNWSGSDVGSGIAHYTIYLSQNGGPFVPYLTNTPLSTTVVNTTQTNQTLSFYSIATDAAGNIEPSKTTAETTVTTDSSIRLDISGRVTTPGGRGIPNALVSIINSAGTTWRVRTTSFGTYHFDDLGVGGTYFILVNAKRYQFQSRILQVFDSLADIDFEGVE